MTTITECRQREQLDADERTRWLDAAIAVFVEHAPDAEFQHWEAWRKLLPHGEELLSRARERGNKHVDTGLLQKIAAFLHSQGRYPEALALARESLSLDERHFGFDHPDTLTCANNLAITIALNGDDASAEPLFRRV